MQCEPILLSVFFNKVIEKVQNAWLYPGVICEINKGGVASPKMLYNCQKYSLSVMFSFLFNVSTVGLLCFSSGTFAVMYSCCNSRVMNPSILNYKYTYKKLKTK